MLGLSRCVRGSARLSGQRLRNMSGFPFVQKQTLFDNANRTMAPGRVLSSSRYLESGQMDSKTRNESQFKERILEYKSLALNIESKIKETDEELCKVVEELNCVSVCLQDENVEDSRLDMMSELFERLNQLQRREYQLKRSYEDVLDGWSACWAYDASTSPSNQLN